MFRCCGDDQNSRCKNHYSGIVNQYCNCPESTCEDNTRKLGDPGHAVYNME
jgi:hypothetical protein